jgi:hypothetical protein
MATDLTIELEDRPGTLAEVLEALGGAGINVEGGCGFAVGDRGVLHVLLEDASAAREPIQRAGARLTGEREVLVKQVEDRPGTAGQVLRKIADAGINVNLVYFASGTRLVIGPADVEAARSALG